MLCDLILSKYQNGNYYSIKKMSIFLIIYFIYNKSLCARYLSLSLKTIQLETVRGMRKFIINSISFIFRCKETPTYIMAANLHIIIMPTILVNFSRYRILPHLLYIFVVMPCFWCALARNEIYILLQIQCYIYTKRSFSLVITSWISDLCSFYTKAY